MAAYCPVAKRILIFSTGHTGASQSCTGQVGRSDHEISAARNDQSSVQPQGCHSRYPCKGFAPYPYYRQVTAWYKEKPQRWIAGAWAEGSDAYGHHKDDAVLALELDGMARLDAVCRNTDIPGAYRESPN